MTVSPNHLTARRPLGGMPLRCWPAVCLLVACTSAQSARADDPRSADGQRSAAGTTADAVHETGGSSQSAVTGDTGRRKAKLKRPSTVAGARDSRRTLRRRAGLAEQKVAGPATTGRDRQATPWYRSGLGSLGIVLAVLGIVCLGARKWIPAVRMTESQAMRVVARASISPKQSVALVQLGGRFVMVGVSPDRMSVLSVISDREEVADLALVTGAAGESTRPGFAHWLAEESKDFGPDRDEASAALDQDSIQVVGSDSPTALTDLLHRLRKLHTKSEKTPATGPRRGAARGSL